MAGLDDDLKGTSRISDKERDSGATTHKLDKERRLGDVAIICQVDQSGMQWHWSILELVTGLGSGQTGNRRVMAWQRKLHAADSDTLLTTFGGGLAQPGPEWSATRIWMVSYWTYSSLFLHITPGHSSRQGIWINGGQGNGSVTPPAYIIWTSQSQKGHELTSSEVACHVHPRSGSRKWL